MIKKIASNFIIQTRNTAYAFRILPTGQPEHLYYGPALYGEEEKPEKDDFEALAEKRLFEAGNMVTYSQDEKTVTFEDLRLEFSGKGKGDIREPFVDVVFSDGSRTTDFVYREAKARKGIAEMPGLPNPHAERGEAEHLRLTFSDTNEELYLDVYYTAFLEADVIARSAVLRNEGKKDVTVKRLLSTALDLDPGERKIVSFHGAWAREMHMDEMPIGKGKTVLESRIGYSGNRTNPFFMVADSETSETLGNVYGFNLMYSGNHYAAMETNAYGKLRVVNGINPEGFSWLLLPGESFSAPNSIMTFSDTGYRGVSRNMHRFIREHVTPRKWKNAVRPILLNSWEAAYFKINENKLLWLAEEARDAGVELFVMDDGWFKGRTGDNKALGDWEADPKKFPGGITRLSKKIHEKGIQFGIWIEPEMVNCDSDLYRAHPEWVMDIPGRTHSEGRNQRILDLANPVVTDYLIKTFTHILKSSQIDYVKWDMNRIMSDVYSKSLPPERQSEVMHRYILGFYRLLDTLTKSFPDILFEGCASGGNRFDPGVLAYFPQIWASDDTDAIERAEIQTGYSYGYPMNCITSHVSGSPNHQTLRETPLFTRFAVASFGVMGYECNFADLFKEDMKEIQEEIVLYKKWRDVMQLGDFYRGRFGNITEWTVVSKDRSRAVGMILQIRNHPNTQWETYRPSGLDPEKRYHIYNLKRDVDIREFGDLVNTASPIHIRQGGRLHDLAARFISMPGETVDLHVKGRVLMNGALHLPQAFSGTGYAEGVRFMPDFSARLYFMEADSDNLT